MLEPGTRTLLMENLRPPEGFAFDCAIGTTFTLDLHALLVAPLAFTLFEWEDGTGRPRAHPAALLEALRRHTQHVHLFCQSGGIKVPARYDRLMTFLEESAIEVHAPNEHGAFHPKVWVLRFTQHDGPVRYRVLVLSRNLTFDRSWDTCLALEGDLTGRRNIIGDNRGLVDFVKALPSLVVGGRPLGRHAEEDLGRIVSEVGRVKFVPPEPFKTVFFHPMGLPGHDGEPLDQWFDRLLVISPFLDRKRLRDLHNQGDGHVLVSRSDELDGIDDATLKQFEEVLVLHDDAEDEREDTDTSEASDPDCLAPLYGLHAKLYVAQSGHRAHVWTGSANATSAARHRNVEMIVELEGGRKRAGIDELLDGDGKRAGLRSLLTPYVRRTDPLDPEEAARRELERTLETLRQVLSSAGLEAVASERDDGTWETVLRCANGAAPEAPDGVDVRCRPLSMADDSRSVPLGSDASRLAVFGPHAFATLTTFFAFSITARRSGQTVALSFVLNLPLLGVPEDRRNRTLVTLLSEDEGLLTRLLLLLLEEDAPDIEPWGGGDGWFGGHRGTDGADSAPLFETLIRALHRAPDRVTEVRRLVDDLRSLPGGTDVLPKELDSILDPILAAHSAMRAADD